MKPSFLFAGFFLIAIPSLLAASSPQPTVGYAPERAETFVKLSLSCVDNPYPNKPGISLGSEKDLFLPSQNTPIFSGCYDWHSAVHGHWALVSYLRAYPQGPSAPAVKAVLKAHFTKANTEKEATFFLEDRNRSFERPYGYGWFFRLMEGLTLGDDPDFKAFKVILSPLQDVFKKRMVGYLEVLPYPVREGTHSNTAFALVHARDFSVATKDSVFTALIDKKGREYFLKDQSCPTAYEPGGEDFISPCLVEADLMSRVLSPGEFVPWFKKFLPEASTPESFFLPPRIPDLKDYRIGHLIGLSLQKASVLKGLSRVLSNSNPKRAKQFREAALVLEAEALGQIEKSGYGGAHWLASFAIYSMTR